jgi:thiol-disulfide isomerase/thioredoxin
MTNIKLELFHASWCGHCINFLPEWRKFAKEISKDAQVKVADYEQSSPNFNQFAKINGNTINGYPTVKITVNGTEYEYNKSRTAEALHDTVKELKKSIHKLPIDIKNLKQLLNECHDYPLEQIVKILAISKVNCNPIFYINENLRKLILLEISKQFSKTIEKNLIYNTLNFISEKEPNILKKK